jgi:hypothetical protein
LDCQVLYANFHCCSKQKEDVWVSVHGCVRAMSQNIFCGTPLVRLPQWHDASIMHMFFWEKLLIYQCIFCVYSHQTKSQLEMTWIKETGLWITVCCICSTCENKCVLFLHLKAFFEAAQMSTLSTV